nr:reverse transcriptase domain-containing protein [Tanacetum cinerariifolium]
MQNQLTNLTDLMTKFVNANTASTSNSGTLPSNTIANPRSDLKAITTRSGVSYDGPQILPPPYSLPPVVDNEPEATKDIVNPTNNGNTEDVQPHTVHPKPITSPISEPTITPVSASRPNPQASIPYPSRRNDERNSMAECLALADLGASISLMPYSVWKRLLLFDLTPTCMTLKLADRSITSSVGIAEDVYVKTKKALIDVFECELTLRVGKEAITFDLDQTSRYSANYSDMTAKRIDVISVACEEYSQERFPSGREAFLNDDPSPPPYQGNYMPEVRKELKICEAHSEKSSVDEPHMAELKELPPHLEYEFLEGDDKLPVIIAKDLSVEEKTALIMILKSHKRAIAWKLSDIKDINPEFCTHKILMEEDFEPAVQHQRRVNPKIHDVIKQEVIKLLEARLIYPIFDSPLVSPVHCVPKKGGFTVVENEDNELIPTRLVTGWLEKTTFTCPYGTFAYHRMPFGLCNAPGTFQRCMMAIFHDMIEKTMELFMDDFSVFGNSSKVVSIIWTKCLKGVKTPIYEPSYNQNYDGNYYSHESPSFPCCDYCGGSHEIFQCQPDNQNVDFSGDDQIQTPQYPDVQENSLTNEEFEAYTTANDANMNDLQFKLDNFQKNQQDFQEKFEQIQDDLLNQMRNFMQNFHDGPPGEENEPEATTDTELSSTEDIQPLPVQEPPQNSDIRQLIREECCVKVPKQ